MGKGSERLGGAGWWEREVRGERGNGKGKRWAKGGREGDRSEGNGREEKGRGGREGQEDQSGKYKFTTTPLVPPTPVNYRMNNFQHLCHSRIAVVTSPLGERNRFDLAMIGSYEIQSVATNNTRMTQSLQKPPRSSDRPGGQGEGGGGATDGEVYCVHC